MDDWLSTIWEFVNITIESIAIEIVDLPFLDGDFPVRYVSLPEGRGLASFPIDWGSVSFIIYGRLLTDPYLRGNRS